MHFISGEAGICAAEDLEAVAPETLGASTEKVIPRVILTY